MNKNTFAKFFFLSVHIFSSAIAQDEFDDYDSEEPQLNGVAVSETAYQPPFGFRARGGLAVLKMPVAPSHDSASNQNFLSFGLTLAFPVAENSLAGIDVDARYPAKISLPASSAISDIGAQIFCRYDFWGGYSYTLLKARISPQLGFFAGRTQYATAWVTVLSPRAGVQVDAAFPQIPIVAWQPLLGVSAYWDGPWGRFSSNGDQYPYEINSSNVITTSMKFAGSGSYSGYGFGLSLGARNPDKEGHPDVRIEISQRGGKYSGLTILSGGINKTSSEPFSQTFVGLAFGRGI